MGHLLCLLEVLCLSHSWTADCYHHVSRHGVVPLPAQCPPHVADMIRGQWVRFLDGHLVDIEEDWSPFQSDLYIGA